MHTIIFEYTLKMKYILQLLFSVQKPENLGIAGKQILLVIFILEKDYFFSFFSF